MYFCKFVVFLQGNVNLGGLHCYYWFDLWDSLCLLLLVLEILLSRAAIHNYFLHQTTY